MTLIATFLYYLIYALIILVFARAIMSWFNPSYSNPLYRYAVLLTEPLLAPIRDLQFRLMRGSSIGMDFSPMILLILLYVLQNLVSQLASRSA